MASALARPCWAVGAPLPLPSLPVPSFPFFLLPQPSPAQPSEHPCAQRCRRGPHPQGVTTDPIPRMSPRQGAAPGRLQGGPSITPQHPRVGEGSKPVVPQRHWLGVEISRLHVPEAGSADPEGFGCTPGWAELVAASSFCIPGWEGVQAGSAAVALAGCRDVPMSLGPGARSLKD